MTCLLQIFLKKKAMPEKLEKRGQFILEKRHLPGFSEERASKIPMRLENPPFSANLLRSRNGAAQHEKPGPA
ncbi:hypothetical protein JNB71_17870 [Rhizobium herbae]|uniref:Uncharacterized protein n=1 Tax=Rhizobium herbae TaxID=508661 RepID=A0ABS7HFF8_9HYPH|nr:hypothetical protein [Rhizobium herbae]MBW9065174.1 hypothetical protein [Rhizobium herbae]